MRLYKLQINISNTRMRESFNLYNQFYTTDRSAQEESIYVSKVKRQYKSERGRTTTRCE
jgi:hypothetical protein